MFNDSPEDGYDPFGSTDGLKEVIRYTNELIGKKQTTVITKESYRTFRTKIRFDVREEIFKLDGSFLDYPCDIQAPIHYRVIRAVIFTAALQLLRLGLVDGGNGAVIPMLFRPEDPCTKKINFF